MTATGPDETLTLVPYGSAKLRITAFPVTSPPPLRDSTVTRMFRTLLTAVSIVVAIAVAGAGPAGVPAAGDPARHARSLLPIWSTSDRLTDRPTSHWTGTPHPMSALVRVDGRAFRVMGHLPADVPALTQRSVTVLPLRTVYVFDGVGIELTLTFLSPMLPHDLELVSRPASYVTFQARATDGRAHDVGHLLRRLQPDRRELAEPAGDLGRQPR